MQVSCLQENLSKGLSIIGRAVAARPTLPVLSHVLMSAEQSQIKLAATDLELSIVCWIGAKVEQPGAITVPARLLTDLVNSLPPERIDLRMADQTLHLSCGRNEADIKGIDAQEFPLIPTLEADEGGRSPETLLDPELLRQMISQVVFAAATDESRPILTGVLTRFDQDTLTMAAADGFRLSVRSATLSTPAAQSISAVIPAKALTELARLAANEQEPIGMYITPSRSQVLFHLQGEHVRTGAGTGEAGRPSSSIFGIDIVSQLIEGNFPNYQQIVPSRRNTRTVLNTEEFIQACKTANIFARSEANVIHLEVQSGNEMGTGRVEITASSAEMGDSVIDLDAAVDGDPVTVAFNARFLIDALSIMASAQVALETGSPSSPGVLKPLGSEDFVHVIMPMHIRSR